VSGEAGLRAVRPPEVPVNIAAPDLRRWLPGNAGIPGVWTFAAEAPGPHVAITGIIHGNEIAGAILLDRWLEAGIRPARGRLTLVFGNLEAYARFDPADPTASRFLDEDLNRVWDPGVLDGRRRSAELRRARELRPAIETVDLLGDMHSMLWPSDPLILAGLPEKGALLGCAIGVPPVVVSDAGHLGGRRLIDFPRFAGEGPAAAVLVEAGAHWEPATVETMEQAAARLLRHAGQARPEDPLRPGAPRGPVRRALVTRTVTANSRDFAFLRDFRGGEVIGPRNALIAMDGEEEIRTPHEDCLLVMPMPLVPRGHTAVRLARFLG
jgi:predicted deacylase